MTGRTPVLAVYLFLALRRVYGKGRTASAVATLAIGMLYAASWVATTFSLLLLTLAWG